MRILITGASGFIGKNFLRKLRFDNCDILATATTERNIQINDYEKVKWVFGDLSDIDFVIMVKMHNHDYIMKGPLAGSLYYTDKKPGRWKDLIDSHRPIISKKGNQLTVTTNHEMRGFEAPIPLKWRLELSIKKPWVADSLLTSQCLATR